MARWEAERHNKVVDEGEMMMASDRKMRMTTPGNRMGSSYRIQVTNPIRAFKFSNMAYPLSTHLPAGCSFCEQCATKRA